MELHFPHLTNGISAPQRVKKRNSKHLPLIAVALAIGFVYYIAF